MAEETSTGGVVTTTNIPLNSFIPCFLDDFEYYHADKTFVIDEGADKCSALVPGIILSGTWAFSADETELTVDGGQRGSYSRHIRALTATTLLLADPATTLPNGSTTARLVTYSAQ